MLSHSVIMHYQSIMHLTYCKFQTDVLNRSIILVVLCRDFLQITALPSGVSGVLVCATGVVTCQSAVT